MPGETRHVPELQRIAKGVSYNFIGAMSRSILGLVFVYVLARILTPHDVGLFFLGLNIITFIMIVGIAGMDSGLRRFISIAHGNQDAESAWSIFLTAVVIALPINILLAGMLFLYSEKLANEVFSKPDLAVVIRILIPYLLFYAAAELLLSVTQGYKQMKYWVICLDVLNCALRIGFALVLSFLGMGIFGVGVGYALSIAFSSLLALHYFLKTMPPKPPKKLDYNFGELVSFSFPVSVTRLLNSGSGIFETVLLGYFVIAQEVAVYTIAVKITIMGGIVLASFNTMFAPLISQLYAQDRIDELQKLYSSVTRWVFSLSLPVFILVAWYAAPVAALFGEDYIEGATVIVILCVGQLVNAATGPSGSLLLMSGHAYTSLWINMLGFLTTLILSIILIPNYGIMGCATAVASAMATMNILRVVLAKYFLGMQPYGLGYWKPVFAAVSVLAVIAVAGPNRLEMMGFLSLLVTGGVGLALYSVIIFGLGLDEADQYVLKKIRQRLGSS